MCAVLSPLIQQAFVPLLVFLCQAQNTNASLRAPILPLLIQQAFVPLVVLLYRARNTNATLRAPSVVGPTPTWSLYSAARILPSQSPLFTVPLMGQTHLKATVNATPLQEFPPFRGQKFADTADGTTPLEKMPQAYQVTPKTDQPHK